MWLGLVVTIALVVLIWRDDVVSARTPARETTQVRPSAREPEAEEQSPDAASTRHASQQSCDDQESDESDAADSQQRGAAYYEDLIKHFAEDRRFHGTRLTGELVVIEVFENWEAIQGNEEVPGAVRVLELLKQTLRARYTTKPIDKAQRYFASLPLVGALTSPHYRLGSHAHQMLRAIYHASLGYRPHGSAEERRERQIIWELWIATWRDRLD